jgi:hypothetical protein
MLRTIASLAAALILALAALPAAAQKRDLGVPATSGWKHANTNLILRARLAEFPRFELSDFGQSELDVAARFGDGSTEITVYVFHPALASVPVWFDRAENAILARDIFANPQPLGAAQPFAPPRSTALSGLRRSYRPGSGQYKSTALAMMPMGDWLVGLRISSTSLASDQLDAKFAEAIAGIGWPDGIADGPVAVPVAACAKPMSYSKHAKLKPPSMSDALFGAMAPAVAADQAKEGKAKPIGAYCRDAATTASYGVYRWPEQPEGYLMAIGDNGRTITIEPSLSGLVDKSPAFGALYGDLDGTVMVYPSFNALPDPGKVMDALERSAPISSSDKGGKNITINTR